MAIPTHAQNGATSLISPTYGRPTPDTHALLNEDIAEPVDVILETRYVQSPQPKRKFLTAEMEHLFAQQYVVLQNSDFLKRILMSFVSKEIIIGTFACWTVSIQSIPKIIMLDYVFCMELCLQPELCQA